MYTGSSDRECKRFFGAEAFIFYPRPLCRFDKANNRGNQSFSGLHAQHPAEPLDDGKEAAVDRTFFRLSPKPHIAVPSLGYTRRQSGFGRSYPTDLIVQPFETAMPIS